MTDMAADRSKQKRPGMIRDYWPAWILACGILFFVLAISLGRYLDERIVFLGPLDAVKIVALFGAAGVWCIAIALIGSITRSARGRSTEILGILVSGGVGLGALGLSAVVVSLALFGLSAEPYYKLETPDSSSQYIVATFTFGETTLTLYRGNGTVYQRMPVSMPYPGRDTSFVDSHRIETGPDGHSYLVYPQDGARKDARLPLP